MNRFAVEYLYSMIQAMYIMNVHGLNCVSEYSKR